MSTRPRAVSLSATLKLCARLGALNAQILACAAPEDIAYVPPLAGDPLAGLPSTVNIGFDYRSFLPVLPVFRDWSAGDIESFADLAPAIVLRRGQVLFFEGAHPLACFVTVRGAVDILAPTSPPTHLRRLAVLGPGQLVGHRGLIDGTPHAARARACEDSVLLALPGEQFQALFGGKSPVALRFQSVVQASLLRSMARTSVTLTRLVNQADRSAVWSAPS